MRLLDRRVSDSGPKEAKREQEPEETHHHEAQDAQGPRRSLGAWDDRGAAEQAPGCLEVLPAPLAAVLPSSHWLGLQEFRAHRPTSPALGFCQKRREGRQGGLPIHHGAVRAEFYLVERTLSYASKPSVKCCEVRLRGEGVVLGYSGAETTGACEVTLGEVRDDRKGECLVGQKIDGKHAAA